MKKFLVVLLTLAIIAGAAAVAYQVVIWQKAESTPAVTELNSGVLVQAEALKSLSRSEQKDYLRAAAAWCAEQKLTLYFEAMPEGTAFFKDRAAETDACLKTKIGPVTFTFDALDYLCRESALSGVDVVAVLNVSGSGQDLTSADVQDQFSGMLHRLGSRRGLSGILLSGLESAGSGPAETALTGWKANCKLPLGVLAKADSTLLVGLDTDSADWITLDTAGTAVAALSGWESCSLPLRLCVDPADGTAAGYLFAGEYVSGIDGALYRDYASLSADSSGTLAALTAVASGTAPALGLPAMPQTLQISYPEDGARFTGTTVYIMGSSDPSQPLLLNGSEVTRASTNGVFGVAVELALGDNTFTFEQNGTKASVTLNRYTYTSTGSKKYTYDDTVKVPAGTVVRVTPQLCSILSDYSSEDNIQETAKQGAVAVVTDTATTIRSGHYTWVYKLASGGWLLAGNCEAVSGETEALFGTLSGIAVTAQANGDEVLQLQGLGTPLAYDDWDMENNTLTVRLAGVSAAKEEYSLDGCGFAGKVKAENKDGYAVLTFPLDGEKQLWGYNVEYGDGTVSLYLKRAPKLGADAQKPLEGLTVLVDAGHGKDDTGALGLTGSIGGPAEKDVNLALALAIRSRLQQLGADVVMTREDDATFLTLQERVELTAKTKPDLFLSVHHNSAELVKDLNGTDGLWAYYYTYPGKLLAGSLMTAVAGATGRAANDPSWSYYYVTRQTVTPAVLFEYGFVVSPTEYQQLCDPVSIANTAFSTVKGIEDYLREAIR